MEINNCDDCMIQINEVDPALEILKLYMRDRNTNSHQMDELINKYIEAVEKNKRKEWNEDED